MPLRRKCLRFGVGVAACVVLAGCGTDSVRTVTPQTSGDPRAEARGTVPEARTGREKATGGKGGGAMPNDTGQGTMPGRGRDTSPDDDQGVMPVHDQGTMPGEDPDDTLVDPPRSDNSGTSSVTTGSAGSGGSGDDPSSAGQSGSPGEGGTETGGGTESGGTSTGGGPDSTLVDPGAIMVAPDRTSLLGGETKREMPTSPGVTMGETDKNGMETRAGVDMRSTGTATEMPTNPGTRMVFTPRAGSAM